MDPAEVIQDQAPNDYFELDAAQLSVVNERFEAYQSGEARTYTWEEVQRMLDEERQRDKG